MNHKEQIKTRRAQKKALRSFELLKRALNSLGWTCYFPEGGSMPGAIIGTHDFCNAVKELIGEGSSSLAGSGATAATEDDRS